MNKRDDHGISIIAIFKALSSPLKLVLGLALTFTGVSGISVISAVTYYTNNNELVQISSRVLLFVGLSIVAMMFFFIILAISSTVALIRLKFDGKQNDDRLACDIQHLESQITLLGSMVTRNALSKYILNSALITELESSSGNNRRIVVMTSKFTLDKGKLLQVILDNIRKGAIYEYLVPSEVQDDGVVDGGDHENFKLVYRAWWNQFLKDLHTELNDDYCVEYKELYDKARTAKSTRDKKLLKSSAEQYFKKHVKEYRIGIEHSLVTLILYQQEPSPSDNWKIIMKLPSISDDDYYAFLVPDEEQKEKTVLIQGVNKFCSKRNVVSLELDD